jgi:hypothetical protein
MGLEAFRSGIGVAAEADEQSAGDGTGSSRCHDYRVAAAKRRRRIGVRGPNDVNFNACALGNAREFLVDS